MGLVFRLNYFGSVIWMGVVVTLLVIAYLQPRIVFVVLALIAGMILAFFKVSSELYGSQYIRQFVGVDIVVTGVVEGDPNTDEKGMKIKMKELKFGDNEKVVRGSIYVSLGGGVEVKRGDTIMVRGKMADGFGVYAGYMYRPVVKKIQRPEPGDWVLSVRNWFAERIKHLILEPESSLGLSYLLGMKTGLPKDLSENLRTVGLVHIVVASGAHLSILVEAARKIFGRLSRFAGLLFSVLFVLFFMCMVGWTPSIMRAGVMAILSLVAWYYGRKIAPWRLIIIVAAFTLVIDPSFVINLGWLLSFASYAGIMILGPKMNRFFYGFKEPGFVASTVITTIAATVMTLPISLYYFGTISLISVVANLLILPTLSVVMGLVFATGVLESIPLMGGVMAWCATKILDFHIIVVEFFGARKEFLVEIKPYRLWVFGLYILVLLPFLIGLIRRKMVKFREEKILKLTRS